MVFIRLLWTDLPSLQCQWSSGSCQNVNDLSLMERQVSLSGIGQSYHTPKYLQVSHTALFSELLAISNQEFRQNLKYVHVSFLEKLIPFSTTHQTMPAGRPEPRLRGRNLLTWPPPLWLYLPAINFQAERAKIKFRWIFYVSFQECQRNKRSENFFSWQ